MKSIIKIIVLAFIIGLTSFTVLNTKAADIHNHRPLILQQANVVILFALPKHNSEGDKVNYTRNLTSMVTGPSSHPDAKNNTHDSICQSKKGNEVYEFTALFNDKLQLLLSYFSTPKHKNNIEDKPEDKESIQIVSMGSH